MLEPALESDARRPRWGRAFLRFLSVVGLLGVVAVAAGFFVMSAKQKPTEPTSVVAKPPTAAKPITLGGKPLFDGWTEKPDLVIVVSGQTFGYLSPCGCSRPQTGGLERRFNLIQGMKGLGWEVIGVDVGEVAPAVEKGTFREQNKKKYAYALKALKEMGYVAVGVGKTEFQNGLFDMLGQFTVGNPNERPIVVGANLVGVKRDGAKKVTAVTEREEAFNGGKGNRPMVEDVEVYQGKTVSAAVVGTIGPSVAAKLVEADPGYDFKGNAEVLKAALAKADEHAAKPGLKVLLYQGTETEAKQVATDFPQFQLILRASDEGEALPPLQSVKFPADAPTTQIVHVGHKGQNVGVVGVFKTDKGYDLRYQLIQLGEEYLTPEGAEAEKDHKLLQLLERYTGEVKADDLLAKAVKARGPHPNQVNPPKGKEEKFAGVDACVKCHAAEVKRWGETKHSHAFEALTKLAKRPAGREFDPDCVVCHTTGFAYTSGFENQTSTKHLLNNQCENCHGPAALHAADPKDKTLLAKLSPWRVGDTKLPDKDFLDKMAAMKETDRGKVQIAARTQLVLNNVQRMCMGCHDLDNDPKFDLWTYLPKIYHSGLKQQDLPPGVGK